MKIKKEDYEVIKAAISKVNKEALKKHIEAVKVSGNYKDLDTRINWDILWASELGKGEFLRGLYSYANDEHINTALKSAVKELAIY